MSDSYKRLFHRWDILRGWIPAILFTLAGIGLELLFLDYLVTLGFPDQRVSLPFGPWSLSVSIALLLSLGNVVLLLTLWMSVFEASAYVRTGADRQIRRMLYPIRMVRMSALVLAPFTILLFIPYVLLSTWFLGVAQSTSFLQGTAGTLYNWQVAFAKVDFGTRFVVAQLIGALGAVVVSGLQMWRARGTRNLMLLLRRRR
jgi:hypothetical protein